jgi:SPP1 family predicted phage head-tail adaptor
LILQVRNSQPARNAAGEPSPDWTDVEVIWGEVLPAAGKELYAGEQANAEVSHKITIRYYPGLSTSRHRLKHETSGAIYDINVPKNVYLRNDWHELLCKEKLT